MLFLVSMQRLLANIIYFVMCGFSLLPLRVHYCISDIMRFFLQYILRYRRKLILKHLRMCFPEMGERELRKTAGGFYEYLTDTFVECIWQLMASNRTLFKHISGYEDNTLNRLFQKHNKVLLLMGHFGNWEMLYGFCAPNAARTPDYFSSYVTVNVAYKAMEGSVADIISQKMRTNSFRKNRALGGVIESNKILRHILGSKGEKGLYVLIADQSPLPGKRVVANFFNLPTLMMAGPEYIATKMNIPVVYYGIRRLKRGKYEIHYKLIAEEPASQPEYFVTREYARYLEEDIRAFKSTWLWSHKRWKRPLSAEEWEEYAKITSPEHAARCHTPEYDNKNLEIDTLE